MSRHGQITLGSQHRKMTFQYNVRGPRRGTRRKTIEGSREEELEERSEGEEELDDELGDERHSAVSSVEDDGGSGREKSKWSSEIGGNMEDEGAGETKPDYYSWKSRRTNPTREEGRNAAGVSQEMSKRNHKTTTKATLVILNLSLRIRPRLTLRERIGLLECTKQTGQSDAENIKTALDRLQTSNHGRLGSLNRVLDAGQTTRDITLHVLDLRRC